MKKKTKIILACIAACIIVAAVAVVIKVNLDKQAKNKSLTEGETAIETYLQSFDEENEEGVRCIAASLRDYHNEVKYAFSISGPTSRMTRERVEELSVDVRKVQEELSMELGWYRK